MVRGLLQGQERGWGEGPDGEGSASGTGERMNVMVRGLLQGQGEGM